MNRREFLRGAAAVAVVATSTVANTHEAKSVSRQCHPVFQPHTADELVEQMRRWKAGEWDHHDYMVALWKERARSQSRATTIARVEAAERRERQRYDALYAKRQRYGLSVPERGGRLPPEQVAVKMADKHDAWFRAGFAT